VATAVHERHRRPGIAGSAVLILLAVLLAAPAAQARGCAPRPDATDQQGRFGDLRVTGPLDCATAERIMGATAKAIRRGRFPKRVKAPKRDRLGFGCRYSGGTAKLRERVTCRGAAARVLRFTDRAAVYGRVVARRTRIAGWKAQCVTVGRSRAAACAFIYRYGPQLDEGRVLGRVAGVRVVVAAAAYAGSNSILELGQCPECMGSPITLPAVEPLAPLRAAVQQRAGDQPVTYEYLHCGTFQGEVLCGVTARFGGRRYSGGAEQAADGSMILNDFTEAP
jgi:hypothetical protein